MTVYKHLLFRLFVMKMRFLCYVVGKIGRSKFDYDYFYFAANIRTRRPLFLQEMNEMAVD